ncbi:MAG: Flagellar biosynthetic protein FliP [Desulfotomaculum sp. 46_80]|nr:MAG: Flagellar biosynthetic protein FliP [Desulfotomaculum sp. 46_80]
MKGKINLNSQNRRIFLSLLFCGLAVCLFCFLPDCASAQPVPIPNLNIQVGQSSTPKQTMDTVKLLVLLTMLSLLPAILVMMTSFTRIIVVLSILRSALGTMQIPSNQIIIGLALFLTIFVMSPVYNEIDRQAIKPYLANTISQEQAMNAAQAPLRSFMLKQTREKDLALFVSLSKINRPSNPQKAPMQVVIPSFIISELKTAFQIGFLIYLPFLIIDLVVASILMSMGMFMLPPIMISLPFKLLLFVLIDGWYLVVKSLMETFH